ncbi:hypothetical protein LCGC14_0964640 [marine sediment metagenome]|uniref:Uncharacterized protein n=1 Tax=marine sediment metagenome TaxID=412755 RepID=A0A0F9NHW2_9ZZZZ
MKDQEKHNQLKREILTHYGGGKLACVRCGFSDIRALSIDHIDGGGSYQRRKSRSTGTFYNWLKKNHLPKGYQTLCMNDQFIKRFENNEHGVSRLVRLQRKEEEHQEQLKNPLPITTKTLKRYIKDKMPARFQLADVYKKLNLPDYKQVSVRNVVMKMTMVGELKPLGNGFYEKIIPVIVNQS